MKVSLRADVSFQSYNCVYVFVHCIFPGVSSTQVRWCERCIPSLYVVRRPTRLCNFADYG